MSEVIVDASAVLALLNQEKGADTSISLSLLPVDHQPGPLLRHDEFVLRWRVLQVGRIRPNVQPCLAWATGRIPCSALGDEMLGQGLVGAELADK